ncbi:MAG: hypothetical protein ACYC6Y_25985 [Thermoguttaceae bacterium]
MSRPKLSSPSQPLHVRLPLQVYEALASLYLAVALILSLALVLAWATFVERDYGTEAVHFAIYDAWWFAALLGLIGINVLCAALIRFPWRRHQTGFVITHAGILVLLVGCIYSAVGGIDAQMPVFEGEINHLAYEDTRHFEVKVFPDRSADGSFSVIDVPFASGPFNWRDYQRKAFFPWHIGRRDRGVLCNQDGIRLEVLDYYRDWTAAEGNPLLVRAAVSEPDAKDLGPYHDVELMLRSVGNEQGGQARVSGARERLESGVRFVFWVASGRPETDAFFQTAPDGPLGEKGQVALYARGQVFRFDVAGMQPSDRLPLGDTGYQVEMVNLNADFMGLELKLRPPSGPAERMILFAEVPEFNIQAGDHGVFGSYWIDADRTPAGKLADAADSLHNPKEPRVDILQGIDGNLLYRVWQSPQLGPTGELAPGRRTDVSLQRSRRSLQFYAEPFQPHDRPGARFTPARFSKDAAASMNTPQALVRLSVDGNTEQFWLESRHSGMMDSPPQGAQRRVVVGKNRRVEVTLVPDSVDVGFHVYLDKFQRKLDPGTSMASHYSSLVDFVTVNVDPVTEEEVRADTIEEGVLITLNEPVTRTDPRTGRSFRIYQEAFRGPFKPGDGLYDMKLGGRVLHGETMPRDELFLSWLTVNYDPGRGLKYFGSMMIVAGIATMFYMKAYFFARRSSGHTPSTT